MTGVTEQDATQREAADGPDGTQDAPPPENDPDDAPAGDDPPEPAQPAVPDTEPLTEKEMEKALAKLDAEAKRHAGRIAEIMGEDANDLEVCPMCWESAPGFRLPIPPDGPQLEAIRRAIGEAPSLDYMAAPDARLCDKCNGLGRVLTGSHVPLHVTKACSTCNGTGYMNVVGPAPTAPSGELVSAPSPAGDQPAEPTPDVDPWGRTPDDPHYGVLPQFVR